jgi:hypothetical protein
MRREYPRDNNHESEGGRMNVNAMRAAAVAICIAVAAPVRADATSDL